MARSENMKRSFPDRLIHWIRSMFQRSPDKDEEPSRPWFAHYDKNVPSDVDIPHWTLNDIFCNTVARFPDRNAICYYGNKFSYADLDALIKGVMAGFLQLGVGKGDRIAMILPNTPQFVITYWACLRLGAVVVPLNPLLASCELEPLLKRIQPKVLVILDRLFERYPKMIRRVGIEHVVVASVGSFMPKVTRFVYFVKSGFQKEGSQAVKTRVLSFDRLFMKSSTEFIPEVKSDDLAALLFTGGVTGEPKAVMLSHRNLVSNVWQTRAWLGAMSLEQDVVLGILPFFHSYGMTACHHLAIATAAMIILEPRFKARRAVKLIKRYRVTVLPGVPTMYRAILDCMKQNPRDIRSIPVCVSGGAPLPAELKRQFEKVTKSRLIEGYGLTEASPITHCNPLHGTNKVASIGLPYPNTDARIVDVNTQQPVEQGRVGELEIRGPQLMAGYWRESPPEETKRNRVWLKTGDIARMDQDGYFFIVDRKKDLILSGGFNIYPSEVEKILNRHPKVSESAVVGYPDDYYGQVVKAFVVLKDGEVCDSDSIREFCKDKIADFKIPALVEFVNRLPKNFIGKILRKQLMTVK